MGTEIKIKSGSGCAAAKHRLVDWEANEPEPQTGAEILEVDETIGRPIKIRTKEGTVEFGNPGGGLVTDVLGFMRFGASSRGFQRQDLFKQTDVKFEGEDGTDTPGTGGLSQDMYASFWRGVVERDIGLFERGTAQDKALPAKNASADRLELVGLFLCKSIIDQKLIGRSLCPFLFEFLLEEEGRTFDNKRSLRAQAHAALDALAHFDGRLAKGYRDMLNGVMRDDPDFRGYTIHELLPDQDPDDNLPLTPDNVEETIVERCRQVLWTDRHNSLLALRRGFQTINVIIKKPVDLALMLRPFSTPELTLLVQGKGVNGAELVANCIEWPESSNQAIANANFPESSRTPSLLKALLETGELDAADFLHWATGRHDVPFGGLSTTENGKIKLQYVYDDETAAGMDERKWRLPQASTCFHLVKIANFSDPSVMRDKLRMAIEHRKDGFQLGD